MCVCASVLYCSLQQLLFYYLKLFCLLIKQYARDKSRILTSCLWLQTVPYMFQINKLLVNNMLSVTFSVAGHQWSRLSSQEMWFSRSISVLFSTKSKSKMVFFVKLYYIYISKHDGQTPFLSSTFYRQVKIGDGQISATFFFLKFCWGL